MPTDATAPKSFIAYYRVSTQAQGRSGLGLDAQRAAVMGYLNGGTWDLVGEFTEIETGKGANALDRRPQLKAALDLCKRSGATLIIAKLDRLARNVHFVSGLIESGADFVAADMPNATKVMIQIHAAMAEFERDQISKRTKEALAAAKARGVLLGVTGPKNLRATNTERHKDALKFADNLREQFLSYRDRKLTHREMAEDLNRLGIKARRGGQWSLLQVQRVLNRLAQPIPVTGPIAGTW